MTIVTIHQPNYIPYLGFFDKMKKADIFVILDNVQFVRTGKFAWQHRQKIRTKEGVMWLTIPVKRKFKTNINKVQIANQDWQIKHWNAIKTNYGSSKYWNDYSAELEKFYQAKYNLLVDITIPLIEWITDRFNIKTKIELASKIVQNEFLSSTDLLIEIINKLNGDTYISGKFGVEYLEKAKFTDNNINLIIQDFNHPIYKQKLLGFVPNLSSIDYLFNVDGKL